MAAAQKLRPVATQHASSPVGRPRLQSLLTAQESKGRQTIVLGASALERLAYSAPCATRPTRSYSAALRPSARCQVLICAVVQSRFAGRHRTGLS